MAVQTQTRQIGDTRIAIAAQLKRPDGSIVDISAAGLKTRFAMYNSQTGVAKVVETSNNVSVTDATNGKVQYDPQDVDVDTVGTYYAYFIVETVAGAQDTFPVIKGDFQIIFENVQ